MRSKTQFRNSRKNPQGKFAFPPRSTAMSDGDRVSVQRRGYDAMPGDKTTKEVPSESLTFAENQRSFVLRKLKQAAGRGVSRAMFIFKYHVTQVGARCDELKRL